MTTLFPLYYRSLGHFHRFGIISLYMYQSYLLYRVICEGPSAPIDLGNVKMILNLCCFDLAAYSVLTYDVTISAILISAFACFLLWLRFHLFFVFLF